MNEDTINYGDLLHEAWDIAVGHPKLWVFGFLPVLFGIFAGIIKLSWQIYATYHVLADTPSLFRPLLPIYEFFTQTSGMVVFSIVFSVIGVLGWLFFPTFCEAAIIQGVRDASRGQVLRRSRLWRQGFWHFKKLWELNMILSVLSLAEIFILAGFIFRNFDTGVLQFFVPVLVIAGVIGVIILIISPFAPQFIVLAGAGLSESLSQSADIVFNHLREVIFLAFIGFLTIVRMMIELILALLMPMLVFSFTSFLAAQFVFFDKVVMSYVGIFVSLGLIWFVARVFGFVHIFTTAVWTLAWDKLKD